MKKAGFILAPLLLFIVTPAFAENIVTGNASSEVHVNTNVSGSSSNNSTTNIHTHIEVETNGDKKVLDEDGPGNYTVTSKSENGGESFVNVTTSGNDNEDNTSTKSAYSDKKETKEEVKEVPKTPVAIVLNFFKEGLGFLLRIVRNL